jgi:hypothetical protein
MRAARAGDAAGVLALLDSGAVGLQAVGFSGRSVLYWAAHGGHGQLVGG